MLDTKALCADSSPTVHYDASARQTKKSRFVSRKSAVGMLCTVMGRGRSASSGSWRSVLDHEPGRWVDFDHVPGAIEPVAAVGSGHGVGDRASRREVVMLEGGRESWRTPPPLE